MQPIITLIFRKFRPFRDNPEHIEIEKKMVRRAFNIL